MKRLIVPFLVLALQGSSHAQNVTTAGSTAVVTTRAIAMISSNAIPSDWRLSRKIAVEGKYRNTTICRGSNAVMQIRWEANGKPGFFTGVILDGTTRVAKLLGYPGSVGVLPEVSPDQYQVLTKASPEINSSVTVTGTNGFWEMYILDGRNTAPLRDLDYTKMRSFKALAREPLADSITNQIEKTAPNQALQGTPLRGVP